MLANKLKELRLKHGLKQIDILQKFGLSSARYSQYETGKRIPDLELVIKFADFYGVSVDELLGHTVKKERDSLTEKLSNVDSETRASVEQFVNFLLSQKEEATQKKITK